MQKNAKQHVQDVCQQLQTSATCLTDAVNTVEKAENKQQIQNTLNQVQSALQAANTTLSNYKE
ncbi:hypothetical protein KPL37_03285 [Clostridium frigoris]|uniref:DUF1657 domain-containing protein n=1 Tax=Clostridium frigoris TaxID=205327 RepID=A0ABS6BPF9_9CLOT|nr:hypothetical protein [Clostridium frigoris]MBU3158798.1 hypothetical protein [Clostridium frigoris]